MLDESNYKIDENNSLLILDDDQPFLKRLSVAMEKRGFNVFPANSMAEFSRIIESDCPNYAIIDLRLSDGTGLDAVESIIGRNILVCSTTLFIKNPNEGGFVSYHQDAKYIGLEPHNWVTAWVALTDSNEENGCMRMWPKSHLKLKYHKEKFNEGNLLTRGQTIENVPENDVKSIELKAGQMSLHHPRIVHGSGINKSNDRRIGFVIQSYIGTNVKQILGKNSVQLARGIDEYNHHEKINRTNSLMSEKNILLKKKENNYLQEIFYKGTNQKSYY